VTLSCTFLGNIKKGKAIIIKGIIKIEEINVAGVKIKNAKT